MAISRILLSGSSFGEPISVATTASTGVVIHQASTTATGIMDEVYLYAANAGTAAHVIYIGIAGSAVLTGGPVQPVATDTPVLLLAGNTLKSSTAAANTIVAYGTTSANLALYGHVNRIAP